ncbi:MAG: response regulator, partial [Desulfuromonadales bacterium]|nr:response regulator [Desulfuromonadales bacterium]NIS41684.1 response regulator [Desulfuromonadales bacterium]
MRGIAKNYFNQSEFQISTARGGQEALRMARAIRPHLIIVDAEMPE